MWESNSPLIEQPHHKGLPDRLLTEPSRARNIRSQNDKAISCLLPQADNNFLVPVLRMNGSPLEFYALVE